MTEIIIVALFLITISGLFLLGLLADMTGRHTLPAKVILSYLIIFSSIDRDSIKIGGDWDT